MEIMKNLFDQSAVNAHSPMMLPTDFQQLRRELMRDWKQAALESLGTMPVDELEEAPLLIAAAADEAVVIVSFADLDGSRMPENLVFAQEIYTGLMVGFEAGGPQGPDGNAGHVQVFDEQMLVPVRVRRPRL